MALSFPSPLVRFFRALLAMAAVMLAGNALAQPAAGPDTVLASNAYAKVTRADYDAELLKLAPDLRPGFANSEKRINDLLLRMLLQKSLAAQAKASGLQSRPENVVRVQLEVDRFLAQLYVESVEAQAAAQFDADRANFDARARELYLVDRAKYETPETITATHILFDTKSRDSAAARALAVETRAKVAAGADLGKLAFELSDDPSARNNKGTLDWFARKDMDPAFAEAAFALKSPGELSAPVQSQFGWHIIRLDGRRPAVMPAYEQVREAIFADMKKRYVEQRREAAIAAVRGDSKTELNREAVDAMVIRIDPEAAARALTQPAPATTPK